MPASAEDGREVVRGQAFMPHPRYPELPDWTFPSTDGSPRSLIQRSWAGYTGRDGGLQVGGGGWRFWSTESELTAGPCPGKAGPLERSREVVMLSCALLSFIGTGSWELERKHRYLGNG